MEDVKQILNNKKQNIKNIKQNIYKILGDIK